MADTHHAHYTRRPSSSSGTSPVARSVASERRSMDGVREVSLLVLFALCAEGRCADALSFLPVHCDHAYPVFTTSCIFFHLSTSTHLPPLSCLGSILLTGTNSIIPPSPPSPRYPLDHPSVIILCHPSSPYTQQTSPPPRPTPSSRMALSALVNSPPHSPVRLSQPSYHSPSPPPSHYTPNRPPSSFPLSATAGPSRYEDPYSRTIFGGAPPPDVGRTYMSPAKPVGHSSEVNLRGRMERSYSNRSYESAGSYESYDHRTRPGMTPSIPPEPSPSRGSMSPTKPAYRANGNGNGDSSPVKREVGAGMPQGLMRLGDRLAGSEDLWQEALKRYQAKREQEVAEIEAFDPLTAVSYSFRTRLAGDGQDVAQLKLITAAPLNQKDQTRTSTRIQIQNQSPFHHRHQRF